ncbi:MAG: ATP-binding protein [Propylenella sp.]
MQASQAAVQRAETVFQQSRALAAASSLGHVVSVSGSRAEIAVGSAACSQHRSDPLSVGKLLTIEAGRSRSVALIYEAEAGGPNQPDTMLARVELLGEIRPSEGSGKAYFDRGIRTYPSVGAPAYEIDPASLETIYKYDGKQTITIGTLAQDERIQATLQVQDLLQKHFAVLGTTGCGKSSAVALVLDQIMKATEATRVLLIDPHNEYRSALRGVAEIVSPTNLNLPFWLFNFEEIVDVIYRRRPGVAEEVDALSDLIPLARARYAQTAEQGSALLRRDPDAGSFTVDSPVPYRMHDILAMIDEQLGKLDNRDERPKLRRLKSRIESVIHDARYQFMFSSRTIEDTMADILRTLFRIPAFGKRITILELAGFPADVVDAVVSVLCRLAFDVGVWGGGRVPLLVACEEAHRYVPADKRLGFGPTRRAISRIAKEGRKYSVYLGLVTQRPAELDPTILSQCSTIFAMRMANETDHAIIRSAVSDAAASTLASLPSIGNREAIAFGEAVSMPMRVRFTDLPSEQLPANRLPSLRTTLTEVETSDFVEEVVRRWRTVARRER